MADLHRLILSQYDAFYQFEKWTPARIDKLARAMQVTRYELFALAGFGSLDPGKRNYDTFPEAVDRLWTNFVNKRAEIPRSILVLFFEFEQFTRETLRRKFGGLSAKSQALSMFLSAAVNNLNEGQTHG